MLSEKNLTFSESKIAGSCKASCEDVPIGLHKLSFFPNEIE